MTLGKSPRHPLQMVSFADGLLFMSKAEYWSLKYFTPTPRDLTIKLFPMVYTKEAIAVCGVDDDSSRKVPFYDKGLIAIQGEHFFFSG